MQEQQEAVTDDIEQLNAEKALDNLIPDSSSNEEVRQEVVEAAQVVMSAQENLYGLISLAPAGLHIFGYTKTAEVFSESNNRALAAAFIPVFEKYSWGQSIITFLNTGNGMAEMALAAVMWPMAISISETVKQDKAAMSKAKEVEKIERNKQEQPQSDFAINRPLEGVAYPKIDIEAMKYDPQN